MIGPIELNKNQFKLKMRIASAVPLSSQINRRVTENLNGWWDGALYDVPIKPRTEADECSLTTWVVNDVQDGSSVL